MLLSLLHILKVLDFICLLCYSWKVIFSIIFSLINEREQTFNQTFQSKMKKETLNTIRTLEEKINTVTDKTNSIRKRIHQKNENSKKLSSTRQKKFELKIIELKNSLHLLIYSKNELEEKFIQKNIEVNSIKDRIRDIRKYGEINPFKFHVIPQDNEIDLNIFLKIAENKVIVY